MLIDDNIFEINGVKYTSIDQESPKTNKSVNETFMMLAMFGGMVGSDYSRPTPRVNLIEEYALIQQKKSKLCRYDRECVINSFNKKYKKI